MSTLPVRSLEVTIAGEPVPDNRGKVLDVERGFTDMLVPEPQGARVSISKSHPTFPCTCGHEIGPNDARQIFKANIRKHNAHDRAWNSGSHVFTFTCPACKEGYVVESSATLTVAVPPVGEARNQPCPCASGRKAKKCHPGGYVVPAGAHDKHP